MAVQGEELASKIEERIKEAINSVVDDIRVSLDDVRDAVNQQFDAALQSVLADAKSITLKDELEELLAGAQAPIPESAPAAVAPGTGPRKLKQAIQEIERGGTQVDVLNSLLDQLLQFGSRSALLILKGDTFSGWKGKGFAASGGNDEMIKRFSAGPGDIAELDRLRLDERVVAWDGGSFAQRSNMAPPDHAIAIPMVIKDKISAAVYVDRMPDHDSELDQHGIELLVFTTGLLIDTLAIRKKVPSPTLSREADADPFDTEPEPELLGAEAEMPPPEPERIAPPQPPPPPAPAEPVAPPAPPEPEAQAPAPEPAAPPQPSTQVRPPAQPPSQVAPPEPPPAAPPRPAPSPSPVTQQSSTQVRPPGGEGSTQYVPPPGVQGGFASKADLGEEAKKHDDAKRFARLLVSEIKLYNEGKVDQGRKNGDLYERLKEDIDRSRQMYDDRVPQEVRDVSNYFYDELVRILADGNAGALGL